MTKKVLFYINATFTHFAIAYYLQKLYDCKLYAVVDITHKPKFFFENQKLVKFEKIWYYHDHIQNGIKHDELFLKEFEKKFNINLWQMIINERIFYRFFDFHKFTRDEMLSISQQSVVLFKKIFDEIKPDFLASDAPVFFHNELLVQMSEQLGIQNLILSMPKLAGKSMITKQIYQFDENGKHNLRIESLEADINDYRWKLIDSHIYYTDNNKSIKYEEYYFLSNLEINGIKGLFANLDSISFWELNKLKKNYKYLGYSTREIDSEFQRSLAFPVFLMSMTLLAGVVVMNIKYRGNFTAYIALSIFLSVLIYYLNDFSRALGETEQISLMLSVWTPVSLILIFTSIGMVYVNEKQ